jgi:hypothetical protein
MDDERDENSEAIGLFWGIAMLAWISLLGLFLMVAMTVVSIIELSKIAFNSTKEKLTEISRR